MRSGMAGYCAVFTHFDTTVDSGRPSLNRHASRRSTSRIEDDGAARLSLQYRLVQQRTADFCPRRETRNRRQAGSDLLDRSAEVGRLSPAGSRKYHFGTGMGCCFGLNSDSPFLFLMWEGLVYSRFSCLIFLPP